MSQHQKKMWRCPVCGTISELNVARCPSCHAELPIKGILITVDEAESEKERQARENAERKHQADMERREAAKREAQERKHREQEAAEEKRQAAAREKQERASAKKERKKNTDLPSQRRSWLPAVLGACLAVAVCVFLLPGLMNREDPLESEGHLKHPQESTEETMSVDDPKGKREPANAEEAKWIYNVLRADCGYEVVKKSTQSVYGSEVLGHQIIAAVFTDTLAQMGADAWDVSDAGDGSVMAWLEPQGDHYVLYLGADGGINGELACAELFSSYTDLESVSFNGAFHTKYATDMYGMFYDCKSLTTVDLASLDTSAVKRFLIMFSGCSSITKLDVSGFDTSSAETIGSMFEECTSLVELDVTGFDTSKVTDMGHLFKDCYSLTQLDVSGFDTAKVTDMSSMFRGCTGLATLDVRGFNTSRVTDMSMMFADCTGLTELSVGGFNTSRVTNMYGAFSGCTRLISVDVSGFDTSQVEDMSFLFDDCTDLISVDVSGWDTSRVRDARYLFSGCQSLTSLGVDSLPMPERANFYGMYNGTIWEE